MLELKIATFNIEWMVSLFGAKWKNWQPQEIPASFQGRSIGPIQLKSIADVRSLCRKIAGVIKDTKARIIGIQEGPPLKEQMETFVENFLGSDYVVHHSNSKWQSISALVHKSIKDKVTSLAHDCDEIKKISTKIPYYPWGEIEKNKKKYQTMYRRPLVLDFKDSGKTLRIIVLHTKSKISKLKTKDQWLQRNEEAVLDALTQRHKLSAEIFGLRNYLDKLLEPPKENAAVVVMGDFNDGPFRDLMEKEFLIHNIVDELSGSLVYPKRLFRHAMSPDVLESSYTTNFEDPFQDGQTVRELIDHILISHGMIDGTSDFTLKQGSCKVELNIFNAHNEDVNNSDRGLRPSDHIPVSAAFNY